MKTILISALSFALGANALQECGDHLIHENNRPVQLNSVEMNPSIVHPGDNLHVSFSGVALNDLNAAESVLVADISILGVKVDEQRYNLCDILTTDKKKFKWNDAFGFRFQVDDFIKSDENYRKPKCTFSKGEALSGAITHKLHNSFPENLKAEVKLLIETSDSFSCYSEDFSVKEAASESNLNSRFDFDDDELSFLFSSWAQQHSNDIYLPELHSDDTDSHKGKLFQSSVYEYRKKVFKENLKKIINHNNSPDQTYQMGMNHFGHLTSEEFKNIYASGYSTDSDLQSRLFKKSSNLRSTHRLNAAEEVNWVKRGAVTPVKNQGACGSCWSFAATGAVEGAYFIKNSKLVSFSEQELVSCDHVDLGCNGGAMDNAFRFIEEQKGLCSEDEFPYTAGTGVRGFCNATCTPVKNSVPTDIIDVNHDEASLLAAVSQQPVAVAIEADEAAFQFYSSGVLTAPCAQRVDHGVLVVGYGKDADSGVDYWLVKNSWGPMWGLQGYIKLERGVELEEGGECGILLGPSYPVM